MSSLSDGKTLRMDSMDPFSRAIRGSNIRPIVRFLLKKLLIFSRSSTKISNHYLLPIVENIFRAWHALGIQTPSDPVNGNKSGVFWNPHSLDPKDETRSYARSAHYDGAPKARRNYHLLTGHAVSKITFDRKRATGVEVVSLTFALIKESFYLT